MSSNDPFNNEFGNSLRDSILNKKLKDLQLRVSHLELDEALIHELDRLVNEIIEILNQKERSYVEHNEDVISETFLDIEPMTLCFTATPTMIRDKTEEEGNGE